MPGMKSLVGLRLITSFVAALASSHAGASPAELDGASPGERDAVVAYCSDSRGSIARDMCLANQMTSILRLGRKPDMAVASAAQRVSIDAACSEKLIPADRFACERDQLRKAGLPVRDAPGAGQITIESHGPQITTSRLPFLNGPAGMPTFNVEQWLAERPEMQPARGGPTLAPADLYQKISPSIYIVVASEHAVELAERTPHTQGSAVAITDRLLLTNCHVVAGRPQISISQYGKIDRVALIYADPRSDRCFLKSDTLILHPVQGVRRFDNLRVGEKVFSVGAPAGLEESFGQGSISGLRRLSGEDIIQNSAPSWHGSSGGGLFDARGNLIGITTAISNTVANLNLSIAAEDFFQTEG